MLLQFATIVLAILQIIAAHENPEVPVVVVSQHQLREDVRKEVTSVVQQATANITDTIGDDIAQEVNAALKDVIANVTDAVEQFLKPLLDELALQNLPGKSPSNPAASCEEVKASNHAAPSGYYWIQNPDLPLVQVYCRMDEVFLLGDRPDNPASSCKEIAPGRSSGLYWIKTGDESSIRVYCDMTRTCGGITGGWMQVANIDMTDSSHTCPQGLNATTHHPIRVCGINVSGKGCSSATFDVHGIEYSQVCGKIIGYQDRKPDGFNIGQRIDGDYVEGVSLTHGNNPRKHIWTFAAARSESDNDCPCLNVGTITVPSFVGNDYFCDTGTPVISNSFHLDDPLWDGRGCGPTSTCCSFNNPPWFSKQLPSPTTDDIEMRLCANNHHAVYNLGDEDVTVQTVELLVQ